LYPIARVSHKWCIIQSEGTTHSDPSKTVHNIQDKLSKPLATPIAVCNSRANHKPCTYQRVVAGLRIKLKIERMRGRDESTE